MAKRIISLIVAVADMVNADPAMHGKLKVVFIEDYKVSLAEIIIPAADISEQISVAGKEASGTGNMKLMLNGAVTLGTYDGANIEIAEQAGLENNYIFGATVEDIAKIRSSYDPKGIYEANPRIKRALDTLVNGTFTDGGMGGFKELYDSLLYGAAWHTPDQYYLLLDMPSYMEAKLRANRDYRDRTAFGRKCLMNTAGAGKFSSDRALKEYAEEIWHIPTVTGLREQ